MILSHPLGMNLFFHVSAFVDHFIHVLEMQFVIVVHCSLFTDLGRARGVLMSEHSDDPFSSLELLQPLTRSLETLLVVVQQPSAHQRKRLVSKDGASFAT
mmetsp:Transcript_6627/g.10950  ORF Transcript_6627/g.10950 Transcript_6627/m.10950 type:complete len:100 (+) Transcript_6627:3-302(+)